MDGMIEKKALEQEARNEGIDKTDDYVVAVKTYENSLAFGMFMQKVVLPEIKVMESEVKSYYDGHLSDYTVPEQMKLDSVVFKKRSDAEDVMRKLRTGDLLSWVKANAEGQIDKDAEDSGFDGKVFTVPTLAADLRSASRAGAGVSALRGGRVFLCHSHRGCTLRPCGITRGQEQIAKQLCGVYRPRSLTG
jgi:hypothetical protein